MPNEASQLTKRGWPDVLAPFTDLMHSLCASAFTEYGLAWGDSAKVFRLRRLKRLLEKTQERLSESGSQPEAVKFSLLNDIMNHGSAEDDDDIQDRWANLLSNAADPRMNRPCSLHFQTFSVNFQKRKLFSSMNCTN